jgi:3-hydroxyacyl-[acyl-carrier-protein] dehydratase
MQILIDNFFKILEHTIEDDKTVFIIQLIKNHPIYNGHFPEKPIVPGVCSIEIIKECVSFYLNTPLKFTAIEQCKFLKPIDPLINEILTVSMKILPINENEYSLSGTIMDKTTPFVIIKCKTIKSL